MTAKTKETKNFELAKEIINDHTKLLDLLMVSMGDGLSIQDLDMRIVFQNKFMRDNFGDHVGEYCYKAYEKQDKMCEGCPVQESLRTGQIAKSVATWINKDGATLRFENIASTLKNDEGQVVAVMELCRNVEDREKAIDELKEKKQEFEMLNKYTKGRDQKLLELQDELDQLKATKEN